MGNRAKCVGEIPSTCTLPLLILAGREPESTGVQLPRLLPIMSWLGTRSDPTSGPSPGSAVRPDIQCAATWCRVSMAAWWLGPIAGGSDVAVHVTKATGTSFHT